MLRLFTTYKDNTQYSKIVFSEFDLIKRRYIEQINHIINYYRTREKRLDGRNLLGRLITTLIPNTSDIIEYWNDIDNSSIYVSKQFNIVSNLNNGCILKNLFYINNSLEVLIYVDNSIDIFNITNWKNLCPLRIIYTEDTCLNFTFPFINTEKKYKQFTVYEIDVKMLMMMYKLWAEDRMLNNLSTDPNVFVAMYVLPNTVYSSTDMIILNRLMNIYNGSDNDKLYNPHPFHILDMTDKLDKVLIKVINHINNTGMFITQLYNQIPYIFNNTHDILKINIKYPTKQSEWVIWLSRVKHMIFLLNILGTKGIDKNLRILKDIIIEIRYLENNNTNLFYKLEEPFLTYYKSDINEIKYILEKKIN